MIKIDKSITNWLDKVGGRNNFNNMIINITSKGLKIQQYDEIRYQFVDGFLSKDDTSIVEFDVDDKTEIQLPIQDIRTFIGILKSFEDLIEIIPEKTQMILKTKHKVVKYQFINPKMIPHYDKEAPKTKYINTSDVSYSFFRSVQKNIQILRGQAVEFVHKGNMLFAKVEGGNHKISESIETEETYDGEVKIHAVLTDQLIKTFTEESIVVGFPEDGFSLLFKEVGEVSDNKAPMWYMSNIIASVEEE